jgi:lysophospholipase L1-like esterase
LHRVLLAALIGLVSAEIAVRVADSLAGRDANFFLPVDEHLAELSPHPYIGYVFRPGVEHLGNLEEGGLNFHINSMGMRGPEMAPLKPPGVYRILCLGGSTTFGTGANEDEATYPARLEHYLNQMAPAGVRYEVGNCGVTGYTTAENLINLELRLVELEPDAIVFYAAANDARPIQARGFQPDYSHYRRSWPVIEVSPFERWMLRNVRLFAWATRGLDPERQYRSLGHPIFVEGFQDLHQRADQGVPAEGLDTFFRNLLHIVEVARANGIVPVVSTFAYCADKETGRERFLETIQAINARLSPFCEDHDVPLLRIDEQLSNRCELFDDSIHMGDEGCDEHGRVAAEEARRLGLFGL